MELGARFHAGYRRWRWRAHLRGPGRRDIAPGGMGAPQPGPDLAIHVTGVDGRRPGRRMAHAARVTPPGLLRRGYPGRRSTRRRASVGVSTLPDTASTSEMLLAAADTAMYSVKGRGKDGIEMATLGQASGYAEE